jgi:acetylornithine aminotransferase apoenzyme (EC 2.6.1.11)
MRKIKQRDAYEIITLDGCFHGRTLGAWPPLGAKTSATASRRCPKDSTGSGL